MNVFHRFTRASLRQNPSRTLVTVIGIVLSMALVTAVIQGAYSGIQFLIRSEVERVGAFHGYYYNLTEGEAAQARRADNVKSSAVWQTVGWAEIGGENEYKPYLLIRSVSDNFTELVAVHLTSGRMPKNDTELLIPDHLASNGGVSYKTGDTVTLAVGRRTMDGYELNDANPYAPESGEKLVDITEKTYTVVGTYQRFDNLVEDYGCPGYTALTGGDGQEMGTESVFFTVRNVSHFYDDMAKNAISENWRPHDDLLRFQGAVRSENLSTFIYGFAGVLIFLIAFGSISLIYNSFAISVSERTRQFGILKSVGATKKQIRRSVLYEALLLGTIGILGGAVVGCLGIGITLWALRDAFAMFAMDTGVQMKLVVSPLGLVIAAAVCLVTTLISAWIPARRADRVSAIDAIRQTGDVKVRSRDVKVSGLTKRLFGFEGMMASKNFKRNRKRYRATVVSLFLSVTLFIAASSFCDYLTQAVGTVRGDDSRMDITYAVAGDDRGDSDRVLAILTGVAGVEKGCYLESEYVDLRVAPDAITDEWVDRYGAPESTDGLIDVAAHANIVFVDDAAFRALCADNGLDPASYYDAESPKALLYNRSTGRTIDQDGNSHWYDVKMINESKLPLEMYATEERQFDGYTLAEVEDGKYYYYTDEYMQEMNEHWRNGEDAGLDRSRAMVLTAEEAEGRSYLTVAATVKETLFALPDGMTALIYPYEMREAVMGENAAEELFQTDFALIAPDHARAFEAIKKELSAKGMETGKLFDVAADKESMRMLVTVVRVFSYGFIILISLIAMANVFNTVSTNVMLRRREFAMLKSIGLGEKGFRRMMNYECIIYGCKGLLWGLPAAVALTYVIYRITGSIVERGFYIPWYSVAIAVGSVFAVVFATMLYATGVIRRDNPIDALRQENI